MYIYIHAHIHTHSHTCTNRPSVFGFKTCVIDSDFAPLPIFPHGRVAHCNTLQHTATHCNTLQHTATHCNTLQHTATICMIEV